MQVYPIVINVVLVLGLCVPPIAAAELNADRYAIAQSITTTNDNTSTNSTAIDVDRADLRSPQRLRVQGMLSNSPVSIQRIVVKLNGKIVKTIASGSLELDLAPILKVGRNQITISGIVTNPNTAIALSFRNPNVNVNQQSAGTGKIDSRLIIEVH